MVCAGLWGRLIAEMVGEDLPVMPVDHPLTFWSIPNSKVRARISAIRCCATKGTRPISVTRVIQPRPKAGKSSGATTKKKTRASYPRDLVSKSPLSPSRDSNSSRSWAMGAIELTPILGELGYDERRSFNGLCQVTAAGPSIGNRHSRTLVLRVCVGQRGPGTGKVLADWMTDGRTVGRFRY